MARFLGIDPASKTGFVALDEKGAVLMAKEITGAKKGSPQYKIRTLHDNVLSELQEGDNIGIEWFSLKSMDTNKTSSGANWAARMAADRVADEIISPEPIYIKKWMEVDEWSGVRKDQGGEGRVKKDGKDVKKEIMQQVYAEYGFAAKTDNIADAFVIAQIVLAVHRYRLDNLNDGTTMERKDIIKRLAYPEEHKRKKAAEKKAKKVRKKV